MAYMKFSRLLLVSFCMNLSGNSINLMNWSVPGRPMFWHYADIAMPMVSDYIHSDRIIDHIPHSVAQQLAHLYGTSLTDIKSHLKSLMHASSHSFDIWIQLNGVPENPANVALHPVLVAWTNLYGKNSVWHPLAGLFETEGLQPEHGNGIAFNGMQPIEVNYHDYKYSPNNARFLLEPNRKVYSCWLIMQGLGKVIVVYDLMINTPGDPMAGMLNCENPATLQQLSKCMDKKHTDYPQRFKEFMNTSYFNALDQNTLHKAYAIIAAILPNPDELKNAHTILQQLAESLREL